MKLMSQLKSARGMLYRKLKRKKQEEIHYKPQSRAETMLNILRYAKPEKNRNKEKYPPFKVLPSLKILSVKWDKSRPVNYSLIRPYVYVSIRWNPGTNDTIYNVIEPKLSEREKKVLQKIKIGLTQSIDISFDKIKNADKMVNFLEISTKKLLMDYGITLSDQEYLNVMYYLYRNFIGLNQIEPLLEDPLIEDISCDGTNTPIFIVHRKLGSVRTNIIFEDGLELKEFVIKMAERCDRYISYAEPLLDGSLPDGTRVQASLSQDVTTRGPTFSIRKFSKEPLTPIDLIDLGTCSLDMMAYLWIAVENGVNILITGGTSTGKTTLLNAICMFIDPNSKIVSIEDTREINLSHENWIPGVTRSGFTGTEIGEISMFDLLKESFRQNPDYLIVGEVRGEEAAIMFQGMASGHASISTMHAGSINDMIKRLITRPIDLSPSLIEVLDLIIVMIHSKEKGRRIKEISELGAFDPITKDIDSESVFKWNPAEDSFGYAEHSKTFDKILNEKGITKEKIKEESERKKQILQWMIDRKVSSWKDVAKYIVLYTKDPEKFMKTMNKV
ncbi:MAG: type II/IV secretion system ATPase subunit [Candidatus Aenigmarchaeota archaeon]|nr:type II/IV secretion system ATPase subunit [Candidatus Aenigmarchaeota archaeon]